jgi:hypothetical protein
MVQRGTDHVLERRRSMGLKYAVCRRWVRGIEQPVGDARMDGRFVPEQKMFDLII